MKIIQTASLLIITLLVIPIFTYFFGTPLGEIEQQALNSVIVIAACAALYCFVVGELTGNVSQVDKLWSLLPLAYSWTVAYYGDFSPRLILMATVVSLWGLRLTYNFSRHGAYRLKFWTGKEDYRWEVLRTKPEFKGKWKWTLFNLFFISAYQNTLILLMTLPTIIALQYNETPIGIYDYLVATLILGLIVFETIADNQQWNFQSVKYALINKGEKPTGDYAKGFLDKGLWSFSRHPNYFAEQSIWVSFYLFSVIASGEWLNWTLAGCLLLLILFQGSASFSEEISSKKYPEYADYQKSTSLFIPFGKRK
jgi:steroid 5-alpha reductase family enzyme